MLKVLSNIKKALWSEGRNSSNVPVNQVTVDGAVSQHHSGDGHNIVGVYNEHHELKPEKINQAAVKIFELIGRGDSLGAKRIIETIEITGSIGKELRSCIKAFKIIAKLIDASEASEVHSELTSFLYESDNSIEKDVYLSLVLRLRILLERRAEAVEIFKAEDSRGKLSRCQFFEFLASPEELSDEASKKTLSDIEMHAIVKGCFRVEDTETALRLAQIAKTTYETYEAKVLYYIALAQNISLDLKNRSYWLIEKKLKDQIENFFDPVISLINESEGKDRRVFNIAIPLLSYAGDVSKELHDLVWQNVERWESDHPELAAVLYAQEKGDSSGLEGAVKEAYILSEKKEKLTEFRNQFLGKNEANVEELLLAIQYLDRDCLVDWLEAGGRLSNDIEEETKTFVDLLFLTTIAKNPFELRGEVSENIQLLKAGNDFFVSANPLLTIKMVTNLNRLGLFSEACQVLDDVLPQQDPWLSPLMKEYLLALYNSHQFLSFKALMTKLHNDAEGSSFYWALKAHFQIHEKDYSTALKSIDRALAIRHDSTQYLILKCQILVRLDKDVGSFLHSLDENLFMLEDESTAPLLAYMFQFCDFEKVENILVNLFLCEPIKSSKLFSDLHFGYTLTKRGKDNIDPRQKNVGHAVQGFIYTQGNKTKKIVVVNGGDYPDSEYVKHSDSRIGKILLNLEVGQIDKTFPQDIVLHKKLEPYVAALQISCEIRHDLNDGSDAFYMLELPTDKSKLLGAMQEHLQRLSSNKKDDLNSSKKIPLLMKGKAISSDDPVRAAVQLFTDPDIVKPVASEKEGEESPEEFVLDAYTAVYVALTGLSEALAKRSIFITEQTKHQLQGFLDSITSDDYMSMGVNRQGKLYRTVKKDIENDFGFFVSGLEIIIESAEVSDVSKILHINLPQELNILNEGIDESVFYTVLLSYATGKYWLTIDNLLGGFVSGYGVKTYSMFGFSSELAREVDFDKRVHGLGLHASGCLPLIPLHDDFRDLLIKFDVLSLHVLGDMLKKYSEFVIESREVDFVLNVIPVFVAYKLERLSCRDTDPIFNVAVRVFNTALWLQKSRETGQTAEQKISLSILQSYQKAYSANYNPRILRPLYLRFIYGHFLDLPTVLQHLREKEHEILKGDDL